MYQSQLVLLCITMWYTACSVVARSIITGSMLGVGFIIPWLWPAAILGVALFVSDSTHQTTKLRALVYGWLTWTVKSLLALVWVWSVYPIDWLAVSFGSFELVLIGIYWLSAALCLGLGGAFVSFIMSLLSIRSWWLLPTIWVIGELVGSLLFSVITYGPGGSITAAFSFGYLGYLVALSDGLFWGSFMLGVYGLTALGAFLGYGMWAVHRRYPRQIRVLVLVSVLGLYLTQLVPLPTPTTEVDSTSVAIIDTQLSWSVYDITNTPENHRRVVAEAVAAGLSTRAEYVLLPEESRFFTANDTLPIQVATWRFLAGSSTTLVIDSGAVSLADTTAVLRASIVDASTGNTYLADKEYLVPHGEYIPTLYRWILEQLGQREVLQTVSSVMNFRPGTNVSQATFPEYIPAVLFCFSSASPYAVRQLLQAREGVPFVVHPVAHGWFHEPVFLTQQLDTMLRIQAAWNRVTIVSAGNQAIGTVYTPEGRMVIPATTATGDLWQVKVTTIPIK